jgi:hypothetical protein
VSARVTAAVKSSHTFPRRRKRRRRAWRQCRIEPATNASALLSAHFAPKLSHRGDNCMCIGRSMAMPGPRTAPLVLPLSETMSSASDPAERTQQVGLDANALFAPTFWSIVPVRPHEYHRRQKPPHWERRHPHTTEAPGLLRLLLPGMAANHRYMTYMLRCHRPTGSLMSL